MRVFCRGMQRHMGIPVRMRPWNYPEQLCFLCQHVVEKSAARCSCQCITPRRYRAELDHLIAAPPLKNMRRRKTSPAHSRRNPHCAAAGSLGVAPGLGTGSGNVQFPAHLTRNPATLDDPPGAKRGLFRHWRPGYRPGRDRAAWRQLSVRATRLAGEGERRRAGPPTAINSFAVSRIRTAG